MVESSTDFTSRSWKRSYELWSHAEQILTKPTTEFERANVIMSLRKAIDRRVRLLDERYSFRAIPVRNKPLDKLALLEFVGVVRPRMLQELIAIRNAVEHDDVTPPDHESCEVFLEFTWYFLRSTDMITQRVSDRITFTDAQNGCWVELGINPPDRWLPLLRGWVPAALISHESRDGWLALRIKRIETRGTELSRLQEEESDGTGLGNRTCDRFFEAEVRGPADGLQKIYNLYFETV